MQLDSHRRQLSSTMPCPWVSRGCQPDKMPSSLPDLDLAEAQINITQRFASRRYNIFLMRAQIRRVVLLMALMEALRVGVPQLVFAGKKDQYPAPGEDDFGIAYWVGYFISYIYLCVFMVVWTPLFSVRFIPFSSNQWRAVLT
jgi:hypothetical protein